MLLVVAVAALCWRVGDGVETNLLGLAESSHAGVLKEIASGSSRQGRVLVEGPAGTDLSPYVERALAALEQPCPGTFKDTLTTLASHGSGLLSRRVREQLTDGKYAEVEAEALARLFGPVPPLFSVKDDPFLFATDYVLSLETDLAPGWRLKDGYPVREMDGRAYALLTVDLGEVPPHKISAFIDDSANMPPPVRVWCGGPAFHAASTSERAKKEVNLLSVLSVAAVLVIGFMLLRSFGFVPRLLCALGVSGLLATAALFWFFPRPHVLTFVFGTSLIGLSVDYVYHACVAGDVRDVRRPLTLAMVTTVAAFVPLMFAAVDVLRQMAVFTTVGLMAAWGWVLFADWRAKAPNGFRGTNAANATHPRNLRWRMLLAGGLLLATVWGLPRVRPVSDPAAFYRPTPCLVEGERTLARLCPENTGRFVYVKGRNLQEALEREESAGVKGFSTIIPSMKRQRENVELVRKFIAATGKSYTAKTGIAISERKSGDGTIDEDMLLDPEKMGDPRLNGLLKAMRVGGGLISPCPKNFVASTSEVMVLEPKRALEDLFSAFTSATCRLLLWSMGALMVLLAVFFRRRFFAHVIPLAASLAATAGTLGILGVDVTFFTLLCFFVLVGLGVDYVIFHQGSDSPTVRRTVFCSFLTSFIGLGALAFTGFAVTAAMGITFACGLFYAWFFAWAFAGCGGCGEKAAESRDCAWHEQGEQSAGAWRLRFMWRVYGLFGKNALKAMCVPVMFFIYPFARPARRALREFRMVLAEYAGGRGIEPPAIPSSFTHLLGFAWSLVDKTDVCTLRKSPPEIVVRDDEGSRSFRKMVASGKGAFLVSTHLGTVEVLPAIVDSSAMRDLSRPRLHAFQQLGHDAEFTRLFLKHFDDAGFTLHAVEDIGVETAVEMQAAIEHGELVLMAGDRTSAGSDKTLSHEFLGRECRWPKGVFAFALMMNAPVFFVTCVRIGWNRYEAHFAEWKEGAFAVSNAGLCSSVRRIRLDDLLAGYVGFLESETLAFPGQWYQFYPFFQDI